jgi:hypothetical protein
MTAGAVGASVTPTDSPVYPSSIQSKGWSSLAW